jgi:hypothetical protein
MKNFGINTARCVFPAILSGLALIGCGGGNTDFASPSFNIRGTLSGLNDATSVQLTIAAAGNTVTVDQNGSFQFPTALPFNGDYSVTVEQQPTGQTCTVANATGSGLTADVSNIAVTCSTITYTVAGTLTGLGDGRSVTLADNVSDTLTLSGNGPFTFVAPVNHNGAYTATVASQPTGQICSITNGSGVGVTANVSNVGVSCNVQTFTVSGTVAGLQSGGQITFMNNGADPVVVSANGAFVFDVPVNYGGSYAVTVNQQPTGQTCTVSSGSGSNVTAAVSDLTVNCAANGYTVGGTVSGLGSSLQLTLYNNGGDALVLSGNGSFTFATSVVSSGAYAVTVNQQPTGQYCSVSNDTGTASANVANVNVSCSTAPSYLTCTSGKIATGIVGKKGGIIDKLQIRCADMVGSTVDTNTTADGNSVGGNGGTAFAPFTCPAGEWISGVSGGNGISSYPTAMASIRVTCSGGSQSVSYNSGGTSAFNYSCQAGKKANGFVIGTAGGYTGFMLGITCE